MINLSFNCPESTIDMPKKGDGFYCGSCNRIIVDYSGKSNAEIAALLKKSTEKNCGIFKSNQVRNARQSEVSSLFRLAFSLVFILGLNASTVLAQDTMLVIDQADTSHVMPISADQIKVMGRIVDESTGEVVMFAKVWVEIEGHFFYALSDFDGYYEICIPEEIAADKLFDLHVRLVGYNEHVTQGIRVSSQKDQVIVNVILSDAELLTGILVKEIDLMPLDPMDFGKTTIGLDDLQHKR